MVLLKLVFFKHILHFFIPLKFVARGSTKSLGFPCHMTPEEAIGAPNKVGNTSNGQGVWRVGWMDLGVVLFVAGQPGPSP